MLNPLLFLPRENNYVLDYRKYATKTVEYETTSAFSYDMSSLPNNFLFNSSICLQNTQMVE